MSDIFNLPSPLQKIETELTRQFNINLFIKRDDLIHPEISGNKWRKLKYNIVQMKLENKTTILTFGGAYSNHITATAKACEVFGFKSIGIIRGEEHQPLNKSLQFAKDCGMELVYVDRENYRNKNSSDFRCMISDFDESNTYVLPEGGANNLAVKGCKEITNEIEIDFDFIVCACGTGTTIAGIASMLKPHQQAIGFAVLKHSGLKDEIDKKFLTHNSELIIQNYPFNGYAKTTPELIQFIKDFYHEHQILLDYVYTGKMMYGIFDLIAKNYFPENSSIIAVHTGGVANANVFDL
jgi:1-aminocyclopropane-1-carboxylate deaminase